MLSLSHTHTHTHTHTHSALTFEQIYLLRDAIDCRTKLFCGKAGWSGNIAIVIIAVLFVSCSDSLNSSWSRAQDGSEGSDDSSNGDHFFAVGKDLVNAMDSRWGRAWLWRWFKQFLVMKAYQHIITQYLGGSVKQVNLYETTNKGS